MKKIKTTAIVHKSRLSSSEIAISGYKHCATVIIAASLINSNTVVELTNVPDIEDIKYLSKIINLLGGSSKYDKNNKSLFLDAKNISSYKIPKKYSQYIHGAIYLLPILLGKFSKVELGNCGGCQIGEATVIGNRPISHMLSILERFGANFEQKDGIILGSITKFNACLIDIMDYSDKTDILTGPFVSGATKTAILAAAFVKKGKTKIINPYFKPDVTELLNFLKKLGYSVLYEKNIIEISQLSIKKNSLQYHLMSDISQIMTYIALSIYTNISLLLTNITTETVEQGLKAELDYLEKIGIRLDFETSSIKINRINELSPLDIDVTSTGIYSDHQPFFALMLLSAHGQSRIRENVWKNRFSYAKELLKLGFNLNLKNNVLIIKPSKPNQKHQILHAGDLRAAAVLIIAALKAPHTTTIKGIHHLKRGYDHFIEDLITLGAKIDIV